jgi:plasmid replication initiation protein
MKREIEIPKSEYDVYFSFPHKEIDNEYNSQKEVKKAIKNLKDKGIIIERGKDYWVGGLINWGQDKGGMITISVNNHIIPFLTDIAKGFTAYSAVVAMSLKSSYSQRMYEFCSRFKDTKKWFISPDSLRDMLDLPKSYDNYGNIKIRVIDVAQKELKDLFEAGQCDLYFECEEIRGGKGRGGSVKELIFKIHTAEKATQTGLNELTAPKFQSIANFMMEHFDTSLEANVRYMNGILLFLSESDNDVDYVKLLEKIEIAKTKKNPAGYFRTILKKDLNLE